MTEFHERKYLCEDKLQVDGINNRCSYRGGHGKMDLVQAISSSCNLYFFNQLKEIPRKQLLERWKWFYPDDFREIISECESLTKYDIGTGLNQALRITPLEVMSLVNFYATRGIWVDYDSHKKLICKKDFRSQFQFFEFVRCGMVLCPQKGTISKSSPFPLDIGGKTGTVGTNKNGFMWFVGFIPSENPRYSIVVVYPRNGFSPEKSIVEGYSQLLFFYKGEG